MTEKPNIIEVRNALLEVGHGKTMEEVMIGIIMAQIKMVVETVGGDRKKARRAIAHYHEIQRKGIDAYCTEFAIANGRSTLHS